MVDIYMYHSGNKTTLYQLQPIMIYATSPGWAFPVSSHRTTECAIYRLYRAL